LAALGRRPLRTLVVAAAVAFGVAVRVWILHEPLLGGYLDSDEAVPGLMARHMLHGEFPVFYWGQAYAGSTEVALIAGVFRFVGSGGLAMRIVPMLLYAAGALLVWRIGRRTIGEPGATTAALFFWIAPAYFVFRSTREAGYQGTMLVLCLTAVLYALRLRERQTWDDAAVVGLAAGLAWWTSIQSGLVLFPLLAWLAWRRLWRYAGIMIAGACLGSLPWLVWNAGHHWQSLRVAYAAHTTYGFRLAGFFTHALPIAVGVRVPWVLEWVPNRTVALVALAALAVTVGAAVVARRRALELPIVITLFFPFVYAASSFTADLFEPRYLILLAPFLALFLGALLEDARAAAVGLALAGVLAVVGLVRVEDSGGIAPGAPDVRAPRSVAALVSALDREHVTRAWADYWVAYRVTFASRERIIVAPTSGDRYAPYHDAVQADPRSAHIFVAGTATEAPERPALLKAGFHRIRVDGYDVYVPASP
jgi:4-amino-4-deoxy-L-arabinose transferase-like glycosyltransferase